MGCGIHLHVEVRSRKYKDAKWRHADIDGAFSDRIYGMFYALAEVRGPYNGITPLKPKGIPDDMSWQTKDDISYVVDNEFAEDKGYCSMAQAMDYIKSGWSKWLEYHGDGTKRITCPDWHSFSWCTIEEMENAINQVFKDKEGKWITNYEPEAWYALLMYMKAYDEMGYDVRAVFWFDN